MILRHFSKRESTTFRRDDPKYVQLNITKFPADSTRVMRSRLKISLPSVMRKNELLSPSSNFSKGLNEDLSSLPTASVASPKANPDQQLKTLDYKPRKSGGGSLIREGH